MTPKPSAQGACPHLTTCPMFASFESASAGKIFKKLYCEAKFETCARYQRSHAGMSVSPTLLPNGSELGKTA